MVETVLRGAKVVDGSGRPAIDADVVLSGGQIKAVLPPKTAPTTHSPPVIDLGGLTLMPGFIDAHAHADNSAFTEPSDTAKIDQGVTTEINGNCGFSLAPKNPIYEESLYSLTERIFPPDRFPWNTVEEYIAHTEQHGLITNAATLVGHSTLRIAVMGDEDRPPTDKELNMMGDLLEEAIRAGAIGLSSGLIYPPGIFSDTDELRSLVERLPSTAIYATHMRNEGRHVLRSIQETLEVVRNQQARAHISHLKIADRQHWGAMSELLEWLDRSNLGGTPVTQDVYPYTAASTMLTALLPPWMQDGGRSHLLERLASEACLEQASHDIKSGKLDFENYARGAGWTDIVVSSTASGRHEGNSIQDIAEANSEDPVRTLFRVLLEENLRATMVVHAMSEQDVRTALAHPRTMIGSDGLPRGTGGKPHPRGFGTFIRVLTEYTAPKGPFSLEEAVRRMSSLVAETFNIPGRGRIQAGYAADLVAIDMSRLEDNATFETPESPPEGIESVWVNGVRVSNNGVYSGKRNGGFLRVQHNCR